MSQVYTVHNVCFSILKSNPPQLVVHANGNVRTSGWTKPRLEPRVYIDFPADGIQDFDFVAVPPTGWVLQVISNISGESEPGQIPPELKGVRVHSETNELTVMLDDSSCSVDSDNPTM
ncbi:hypothetical protein ABWH92_12275 [Ahrensia marina]|uniref:hypothetical protein n=1 Tax=Ahrensia marina TaxID=1514904 RepID=UPI0035D0FFEF